MKIYLWVLISLCCVAISCRSDDGCCITNPVDGTLVNGVVEVTVEPSISYSADSISVWIDDSCAACVAVYDPVYLWDTREYSHGSEHTLQGVIFYEDGYQVTTPIISVSIYSYRNVIAEAFIESDGCGFSGLAEKALTDSLAHFGDTLVVICYHLDDPYKNAYSTDREAFYNTMYDVPYVIFDGFWLEWTANPGEYHEFYENAFLSVRDTLPSFALDVHGTATNTTGTITVEAIALKTLPQEDIKVITIVMEDSLEGWYFTHNRVCRFIEYRDLNPEITYPDTNRLTITFSHNITVHNMTAAIFIQNMTTRQILQSTLVRFD